MYGPGLFRMLCGGLFFLLFWVVVIGLIVWAITAWSRSSARRNAAGNELPAAPPAAPASADRALDILRERYARGEITKEQYDAMRNDLTV